MWAPISLLGLGLGLAACYAPTPPAGWLSISGWRELARCLRPTLADGAIQLGTTD